MILDVFSPHLLVKNAGLPYSWAPLPPRHTTASQGSSHLNDVQTVLVDRCRAQRLNAKSWARRSMFSDNETCRSVDRLGVATVGEVGPLEVP